jgi:periplasmic protein TonB
VNKCCEVLSGLSCGVTSTPATPTRRHGSPLVLLLALVLSSCSQAPPETPPRQLPGSPFQYPEALWDAGVEGETLLELYVSQTGTVDSARVNRTSGQAEFDSAAVRGAHELRFEPARRGEDSVAVRVLLPVQFHLQQMDSSARGATPAAAAPADSAAGTQPPTQQRP